MGCWSRRATVVGVGGGIPEASCAWEVLVDEVATGGLPG